MRSWVFLVPDLYPQNISFAHSTYEELKKELEKRFESELKRKNCDDRLKDRFLVHCFKYDLEVLLLVVDIGVLISAFAFRGIPERVARKAFTEAEVWVSPQLLREYRDTPIEPEADGTITHTQLRALLSGIASFVVNAKLVVKKSLSLCRDEGDNMVVEGLSPGLYMKALTEPWDLLPAGVELNLIPYEDAIESIKDKATNKGELMFG